MADVPPRLSCLCPAQSLMMLRELEDVEVVAPDEACFECEVSVPVLKSPIWSLNGEALQPSSRVRMEKMGTVHRLTLRQTSADMSGTVEFTSGKAKSRAQLQVLSTFKQTLLLHPKNPAVIRCTFKQSMLAQEIT